MIPRPLIRLVSLLLVPCLLAEPSLAAGLAGGLPTPHLAISVEMFTREALSPQEADFWQGHNETAIHQAQQIRSHDRQSQTSARTDQDIWERYWSDGDGEIVRGIDVTKPQPRRTDAFWTTALKRLGEITHGQTRRLLDVGTGKRFAVLRHANTVLPQFELYGIDRVALRTDLVPWAAHVHFYQRTFDRTGFPDNYFDAVTSHHALEFAPDRPEALRELYRVMRPGGYALLVWHHLDSLSMKIGRKESADRQRMRRSGILEAYRQLLQKPSAFRKERVVQAFYQLVRTLEDRTVLRELADLQLNIFGMLKKQIDPSKINEALRILKIFEAFNQTEIAHGLYTLRRLKDLPTDEKELQALMLAAGFYVEKPQLLQHEGKLIAWGIKLRKPGAPGAFIPDPPDARPKTSSRRGQTSEHSALTVHTFAKGDFSAYARALAARAKEIRQLRGLFERNMGAQSSVSRFEQGEPNPRLKRLRAFANYYDVPLLVLLDPSLAYLLDQKFFKFADPIDAEIVDHIHSIVRHNKIRFNQVSVANGLNPNYISHALLDIGRGNSHMKTLHRVVLLINGTWIDLCYGPMSPVAALFKHLQASAFLAGKVFLEAGVQSPVGFEVSPHLALGGAA